MISDKEKIRQAIALMVESNARIMEIGEKIGNVIKDELKTSEDGFIAMSALADNLAVIAVLFNMPAAMLGDFVENSAGKIDLSNIEHRRGFFGDIELDSRIDEMARIKSWIKA